MNGSFVIRAVRVFIGWLSGRLFRNRMELWERVSVNRRQMRIEALEQRNCCLGRWNGLVGHTKGDTQRGHY